MRTIIAGGRDISESWTVERAIKESGFEITTVLSGACSGVDACGEGWAMVNHVPVEHYPADWKQHGKAAGPIRNEQMAQKADALILVWDGKSRGSASMKRLAEQYGLRIHEHIVATKGKT